MTKTLKDKKRKIKKINKSKITSKYYLKIIHSTLQDVISVVATVTEVTKTMKTNSPGIEDCKQRIPMHFEAQKSCQIVLNIHIY